MEKNYSRHTIGIYTRSFIVQQSFNFFFLKDASLCNYTDDSTLYTYNKNLETVISNLRQDFSILFSWFYENYTVLNTGNCHFKLSGVKENEEFDLICNEPTLKHSSHEKKLGVTIDNKLSFDEHNNDISITANKKLNAFRVINHYMKQNQKELLLLFIVSHFSYCLLI